MTSANKPLEKKISIGLKMLQNNWIIRQLCVHRDMKDLGSLGSTQEATPLATLTHLSCSPNFPRASYLDERTLSYEPIVDESGTYRRLITSLNTDCLSVKLCLFPIISFHLVRTYAIMRILMGVILRLKRSQ